MSFDVPELDWSDKRVLPEFQPVQHLNVYDFRGSAQDVQLAATTCAGLINRPLPRVYMMFTNDDEYWLQKLTGWEQAHAPTIQQHAPTGREQAHAPTIQQH